MGNQSSRPSSPPSTKAAGTSENSKKFEHFTELADDVAAQVFSALPLKEKAALATTSKRYYGLFSQHIHAAKCLMLVAHGDQTAADEMLRRNPKLLLERTNVTDYSGRTFKNITAYEYAYWAKDTHMCRMLEAHMDKATKAKMLGRIDAMERDGLTFEQHGVVVKHSKHFDFTPLITALRLYVQGYDNWYATNNMAALTAAWMKVGILQRDMPVHVANEYCRTDRSFNPRPEFNERVLPRSLRFYNLEKSREQSLFPLVIAKASGLGIDFVVGRLGGLGCVGARAKASGLGIDFAVCRFLGCVGVRAAVGPIAAIDLAAISHLDEIRTVDLTRLRESLLPRDREPSHSMRV